MSRRSESLETPRSAAIDRRTGDRDVHRYPKVTAPWSANEIEVASAAPATPSFGAPRFPKMKTQLSAMLRTLAPRVAIIGNTVLPAARRIPEAAASRQKNRNTEASILRNRRAMSEIGRAH